MAKRANPNRWITASILRKVSRAMLPFYIKISKNRSYATQWSRAVVRADLAKMQKLLRLVSPSAGKQLGSNGIGYFISFPVPGTNGSFSNGTTIPPGSVQFVFETRVHRCIARSVLPLYYRLATNCPFALALAKAIRRGDTKAATRMIRQYVRTPALRSVLIESSGFALTFRYSFSKYKYRNLFIFEID